MGIVRGGLRIAFGEPWENLGRALGTLKSSKAKERNLKRQAYSKGLP
jgi:hypothetical protein